MATAAKIPDVHLMTVFAAEQQVGLESVFDHVGRAPFAGHQRVESQDATKNRNAKIADPDPSPTGPESRTSRNRA